ncbi:glycoside hydrolase family 3 N-terminal domain-containing protein [Vagococcus entomophilus]|uniref:beta-glucosidase n=1 Tax=Vagococcus entomophilus TaxID=1160095 RepID=A0A430AK87_9ENTE|nr:glycoside hydrolase family 3 N-terminal domain-containing protein [Vagococcus entomophilus]RSU08532.1 beta-glucosidase [Vagococcus entomophilus]
MKQAQLEQLLGQMTRKEKIEQLQQVTGDFFSEEQTEATGPLSGNNLTSEDLIDVGSALSLSGAKAAKKAQKEYLEKNRLGIPLLLMADIVHGYRTIFPIPLGLAASWNPELVEKTASVAAEESSVSGIHITFSPMVDLVRDPRWGRVLESTGEDPYLNKVYAKSMVEGYQGKKENALQQYGSIAACVKHFAAYGAPEGGREYNTVNMSERELRENYLPSYKAAVDAGSKLVMTSFNTVDGIPASVNKYLNRKILREEWAFDGVLISDWAAMKEAIHHGVAATEKEVAKLSIEAGVDIEMMTFCYHNELEKLIESGEVSESLLDEAVLRILTLKNELGLFENPDRFTDETLEADKVFSKEFQDIAQIAAEEAIVLLENKESVLPISENENVLFVGSHVDSSNILGTWSWKGDPTETKSVADILQSDYQNANTRILPIASAFDVTQEELETALKLAEKADKVVILTGETPDMSGEASSRSDIRLPKAQRDLIEKMTKVNAKTIAVLFNGRPLDVTGVSQQVQGLVEAWFPGTSGAKAILNILYGNKVPQGKLTMSFPRNVGQVPVYYNHFNTGRPIDENDLENKYVSKYLDVENTPLYPFGYGLSYTKFDYRGFKLVKSSDNQLKAQVTVKNTGKVAGNETVQWYVRDKVGEVVRPLKELKGFDRIFLEKGEEKVVTHEFSVEELGYVHSDLSQRYDQGEFVLMVGSNSAEVLEQNFTI